jgi:hypothetical protein
VSSKFVQIKAVGFKLAPLWGLYTGERPQGHHGPLVYLSPLVLLFLKLPICKGNTLNFLYENTYPDYTLI